MKCASATAFTYSVIVWAYWECCLTVIVMNLCDCVEYTCMHRSFVITTCMVRIDCVHTDRVQTYKVHTDRVQTDTIQTDTIHTHKSINTYMYCNDNVAVRHECRHGDTLCTGFSKV